MVPDDFAKAEMTLRAAGLPLLAGCPAALTAGERVMLYALAFNLRHGDYLEVGTLFGGSALIVADAFRAAGHPGLVVGVDPQTDARPSETTLRLLGPNFWPVVGKSPGALAVFEGRPRLGLVLIDGDHSPEAIHADFAAVLPLLLNGAVVLFHDVLNAEVACAAAAAVDLHAPDFFHLGRLCAEPHYENGVPWGGLLAVREGRCEHWGRR